MRSFSVEIILKEQIIDEQILESVPLQRKSIYRSFCRPQPLSSTATEKVPTEQNGPIDNIDKARSNLGPTSLPQSSSLRDQLLTSDSVPMTPNAELIVQLLLLWKSSLPWKVSDCPVLFRLSSLSNSPFTRPSARLISSFLAARTIS